MKKYIFASLVGIVFSCIQSYAQELQVKDDEYCSTGVLPTNTLTIEQSFNAIESLLLTYDIEKVLLKNESANFIAVQFAFELTKDPLNRLQYLYLDTKCYIKKDSIRLIVDHFKVSYYLTADNNSEVRYKRVKASKKNVIDDIGQYIKLVNEQVYSLVKVALIRERKNWDF